MLQPRDYFRAEEHSLYSLLTDGNKVFCIPDYQRNFAWTGEQLEQLWDDFYKAVTASLDNGYNVRYDSKPHFFGAVVLTETDAGVYEVTDGQQRLTASTIFLKVLLEQSYRIQDPHKQAGVQSLILQAVQRNGYGQAFQPRLELGTNSNEFFRDYVLTKNNADERDQYLRLHAIPNKSARQLIKNAHDYFTSMLTEKLPIGLQPDVLHDKLMGFINVFTRQFMFLKIVVRQPETAYVIFETLNKRGKDLSESDLIKNELFKSVHPSHRDLVKQYWDAITDNIESEDLTEYIRFQYVSKYGPVKPSELFSVIQKHIKNQNALDYLKTLVEESEWYAKVTLTGTSFWRDKIIDKLREFDKNKINVSLSIPLLLTGAILYNQDETQLYKLVNGTLTFCFRYFTIGDASVAELERQIGLMSRTLRNPKTIDSLTPMSQEELNNLKDIERLQRVQNLDDLLGYMEWLTPDTKFMNNFAEFSAKSNELAFYILNGLEKIQQRGVRPLPHGPGQHVEHIMPKQPSRATSRANEWGHVRNDALYKDYVYRLGNLLILESEINQAVRNRDFDYKKQSYVDSGLFYPKDIASRYSIWDFFTIEARQKEMAQAALEVWTYR